ncbi:39S ribosomal protein L32, mitochondrial [Tupaia chinensis]|uniref:39S ribosomal protein L32, mitochondrial n=1 Tax=Tupaia chinensis TaxID=246437 RepID=L9KZB4_TUPCH|nr:39S ribosomal protein L32, mitochondrial [Tupaia chinensis]
MALAMLVLVARCGQVPRGPLGNCWEGLQRRLQQSRLGFPSPRPPWGPALALEGPAIFTEPAGATSPSEENASLLDSIFRMAAPTSRRSPEVHRCGRRNPQKLLEVKNDIDGSPECGHLKRKQEEVRKGTEGIRRQLGNQEGSPFKAPAMEAVVLYTGETPSEQDQGKRTMGRGRKRPAWLTQN